jgi:hypothetical protein
VSILGLVPAEAFLIRLPSGSPRRRRHQMAKNSTLGIEHPTIPKRITDLGM